MKVKNKPILRQGFGGQAKLKVLVAMSGGVDSSVAAALLKKQGFDVSGVFMRLNNFSKKSEQDAKKVAKKLNIPFYVWDFQKEFKKKVIDYFIDEYQCGHTPNPCVECNKFIKFGILLEKAKKIGFDYLATGHYARLRRETRNSKSEIRNTPIFELLKTKDEQKDQSYFLWQLNQKQLSRILFPVGMYTKIEVRKLAKKFKLPTAETPESQEVCFIQDSTENFLRKYLKTKPGNIIDKSGKILGQHQGLWFYTIGQRRGIPLQQGPWYVVLKEKNNIIVSKDKKDLESKKLMASGVNFISETKFPLNTEVKIRYKSNLAKAKIVKYKNNIKVIFNKPQSAVTHGQSVVFYKGKELLGGGIIK